MTDAETDDRCSMVHASPYANDMDIAAIIQTNSCFQRKGWSHEPWLRDMIDAYGQVLPCLRVHDPNYPTAEYLHSISFVGDEDPEHIVEQTELSTWFAEEWFKEKHFIYLPC